MFDSLFEDSHAATNKLTVSSSTILFVPKRPSHGLCGLRNQGATCYLNSLIQTLFLTPEFRDSLLQLNECELGRPNGANNDKTKERIIPIQLQRLFSRLLLLDVNDVTTSDLLDSFGWTNNEELQQQDVQELNRALFAAIEQSLVGTSGAQLVNKLYRGSIVNKIECHECHKTSSRQEDFLDLCMAVSGHSSLHEALANVFLINEQLNMNNKYFCSQCNKLVDATKSSTINHLPAILTLSLLRFDYDIKNMERVKNTDSFSFPLELDMAAYCGLASSDNHKYDLFSVVIHRGSAYGGHYHAYIRDVNGIGQWTSPDEEKIYLPAGDSGEGTNVLDMNSPLEILSTILRGGDNGKMAMDRLCGELMKITGVSWNNHFKPRFGPFLKFIQKHDDIFVFNPANNQINLKEGGNNKSLLELSHTFSASKNRASSTANTDSSGSYSSGDKCFNNRNCDKTNLEENWFDFDDNRIRSIFTKDIEKQFCGKECAYLLFYRKATLNVKNNKPCAFIPQWLQDEINAENIALEAERLEYEMQLHSLNIDLLDGHNYVCDCGYLKPKDNLSLNHSIPLTIDKRKSLHDLYTSIQQMSFQDLPKPLILHIAKETQMAGIHLYEKLDDDANQCLKDSHVVKGTKLFLWDGKQVKGKAVHCGEDYEPIQLDITYSNGVEITKLLPKLTPLDEVKVVIGTSAGLDVDSVRILWPQSGDSKASKRLVEKAVTLNVVCDGGSSVLKLWQLRRNIPLFVPLISFSNNDNNLVIVVENRCSSSNDNDRPKIAVKVDKDLIIKELLLKLKSYFKLENSDVCLKILASIENLLLSIDSMMSVEACGVTDESILVLLLEKKLKPNEMTLTFNVLKDNKVATSIDIVVDKSSTVKKCLHTAVEKLSLQGTQWHLCKTNWLGEVTVALDDLSSTLDACSLKDGDCLIVQYGSLDILKLSVWKLPSLPPVALRDMSSYNWFFNNSEDDSVQSCKDIALVSSEKSPLGDVQIVRTATLDELREQITTLPLAADLPIPTIQFMRLWLLENETKIKLLRGGYQTLQQLKLANNMAIGVQLLMQEEGLSKDDIVLFLQMRNSRRKTYTCLGEFVWKTSQDKTITSLTQTIANLLALPNEHLLLAKYWSDRIEWMILRNAMQLQENKKGKKVQKNAAKKNLLLAPYFLTDGDIIGVKNLAVDPEDDDFMTSEDILKKENIKRMKEEKANRDVVWQASANSQPDGSLPSALKERKPEANLKIHVPDYS